MNATSFVLCAVLFTVAVGKVNGQSRSGSSDVPPPAESRRIFSPPDEGGGISRNSEIFEATKEMGYVQPPSRRRRPVVAGTFSFGPPRVGEERRRLMAFFRPPQADLQIPTVAEPPDGARAKRDGQGREDFDDVAATGFRWKSALGQSLLFLAVQHGYAMTQPKTRRDLKGPFFRDYFRSVKSLNKWDDGGRFFTNYIAHPMQGSLTGFIQIHNDPGGSGRRFGSSPRYWRSRMKALAWSAAWSTQFEIGPVSQASIGNVGLHGKQTYVDLVMTPIAGTGLLVAEDAVDRYVIRRIERRTSNFYLKIGSRMVLNPTRSIANLLRFREPWHRDAGLR